MPDFRLARSVSRIAAAAFSLYALSASAAELAGDNAAPPRHIDPNAGIQKFANGMSLSDEQTAKIIRWVDSGAPIGDPKAQGVRAIN